KKNSVVMRKNITASRPALAGRNHLLVAAVRVHRENLVALQIVARGLEDDLLSIRGKISLSIRPAERELPYIAKMLFVSRLQISARVHSGRRRSPGLSEPNTRKQQDQTWNKQSFHRMKKFNRQEW